MKMSTAIKTAVHSRPGTADILLNPRILPFVCVSGCREGGILELSVGVVVAVTVAVTVVVTVGITVRGAVGDAVAVVSGIISVPGIIKRRDRLLYT